MGVKIWELIPKKEIGIKDLKGKILAVDASPVMYQFLASIRQRDGTPLQDSKGRITSHLMGIITRVTKLMSEGLKLIFIFDGVPPDLKFSEREQRESRKRIAEEKLETAKQKKDIESILKYSRQSMRLNYQILNESKELLKALGIPVIQAPSEAEAQCAFMAERGDAWAVVSQDADALLFGTPRLIRNLTISQRRRLPSGVTIQNKPEIIELKEVLKSLKINQDKLIALSMLVGSVDHYEPTIIKDNNMIKVISIGEYPKSNRLKVPCFDLKSKKIMFRKVNLSIKHKVEEPLYEITTTYNRKVRITKSHGIFVNKDNEILPVKPNCLRKGDQLVIPLKIPNQSKLIIKINLAQELWKKRDKLKRLIYCDGPNIQEIRKKRVLLNKNKRLTDKRYILTKKGLEELKSLRKDQKIIQTKTRFSESTILDWEKGKRPIPETNLKKYLSLLGTNFKKFNSKERFIEKIKNSKLEDNILPLIKYKNKSTKSILFKTLSKKEVRFLTKKDIIYCRTRESNPIKSILEITPEFIRLIGYFLAEGHLNNNCGVSFSFALEGIGHDDYCVKDVLHCIKKTFRINAKVYNEKSTRHICIDNCVVHDIFAHILELNKQDSKTKRIPYLIFNIGQELQLEFLKGLFLGDGSLRKDFISFNTASYDVAAGLSYIFLQQGIVSSTVFHIKKNYNMKSLNIRGKAQLLSIKRIWEKHNQSKILINHCNKPFIQRQNMEIDKDLGYVKIKSINKVMPANDYVYDFSVEGQNFISGFGGICCHNTDYNVGGVKRIGAKTGLKLVQQYKKFDKLFSKLETNFNWKKIYAIFKSMPVMKNYQLRWKAVDEEKIKEILVEKHDFNKERIESLLEKLYPKNKDQQGLRNWTKSALS